MKASTLSVEAIAHDLNLEMAAAIAVRAHTKLDDQSTPPRRPRP